MWIINGQASIFAQSVLATDETVAELTARGPNDPPIPERCCAICSGEPYNGFNYSVFLDVFQTQRLETCTLFTLEYYDDGASTNPWHCYMYSNSQVTTTLPSTGVLARYTYGSMSL